ncbi:hypothetical protein OEZ86_005132 [Tetradesmus obliquus]|nr:hypothetical protein OEZ86_005132 [Tetradesmus obliquus]
MLPALFSRGQPDWQDKVNSVLQTYLSLPDFFNNASDPNAFRIAGPIRNGSTYLELSFEVVNGAVCVTGINAQNLRVNTTVLTQLLPQLPFLKRFNSDRTCESFLDDCSFDSMPPIPMPLDLAAAAPAALTTFELTGNNLTGTLPMQWGQWSTIQELTIRANELLSGPLPDSWVGMRSLTSLALSGNPSITGSLPASYGAAAWAATITEIDLSKNAGLVCTIPSSWANIKAGRIDVDGTSLGGCVPDQLLNTVTEGIRSQKEWIRSIPVAADPYYGNFTGPCSQNSSELAVLQELKAVLGGSNPGLSTWTPAPPDYTPEPLPGAPPGPAPYHCRNWRGVSCDSSNRVSGLDLASTACIGLPGTPLPLAGALLDVLRKLPWLQSLNLSSCSLQGQLPEPSLTWQTCGN